VPALFGWLSLDRRGRWFIRGELISRPQIIETINRNYAADEHGRWYFQNGPQRGYIALEYAPLVLRQPDETQALSTHTGLDVSTIEKACLDEEGAILLLTEHGPGVLADTDLDWALQRLFEAEAAVDEGAIERALRLPSGTTSALVLQWGSASLPVLRLDRAAMPQALGFVCDPQPRDGERVTRSEVAQD
jgi:hypothetical protein